MLIERLSKPYVLQYCFIASECPIHLIPEEYMDVRSMGAVATKKKEYKGHIIQNNQSTKYRFIQIRRTFNFPVQHKYYKSNCHDIYAWKGWHKYIIVSFDFIYTSYQIQTIVGQYN